MTLAAAGLASAALPDFGVTASARPAKVATRALTMSPVFAEASTRLQTLRARYLAAVGPYMELDEDFRWLRASNNEAELDRYCAHPAVRAFHVANREFGPLLLRALSTCPRTIADCEIQEWCESLAREDDPDDPLLQYWEPIMRWQREFVRRRAETQSSHA